MTTTMDLVNETRSLLDSGSRPELNRLNGAMTNSQTTAVVEFAAGSIAAGAKLAIDFEEMYVWSLASLTATVQRAMNGSAAAAHDDDDLVYVNPRWSDWQIFRALREELQSYSSPRHGLFRMRTVDVTYNAARYGYDLTSVTDILDVHAVESDGWLAGDRIDLRSWRLIRDQDTADFASGHVLYLYDGGLPGKPARVQYKAPFATLTTSSTDVATDTGLHAEAHDIPPLGAAARLVAPREVKRAFTESQPESRAAAEVPPGTNRGAAATLLALRDARLREESTRLRQKYPTRSKATV